MTPEGTTLPAGATVRVVRDDQWSVVGWLWQAFREDLSPVVNGLPYADGRFGATPLSGFPSADGAGYLAVRAHPNTGEEAPVALALVRGLCGPVRSVAAFWVAPPLRRTGLGGAFAMAVLAGHPGEWEIAFQHENRGAGAFWRRVAEEAFGPGGWRETEEPVPDRPLAPPDHHIRTIGGSAISP